MAARRTAIQLDHLARELGPTALVWRIQKWKNGTAPSTALFVAHFGARARNAGTLGPIQACCTMVPAVFRVRSTLG